MIKATAGELPRRGSGKTAAELELERKHRNLEKFVTTLSIQKCLLEGYSRYPRNDPMLS